MLCFSTQQPQFCKLIYPFDIDNDYMGHFFGIEVLGLHTVLVMRCLLKASYIRDEDHLVKV